jgi:hypothetical protein
MKPVGLVDQIYHGFDKHKRVCRLQKKAGATAVYAHEDGALETFVLRLKKLGTVLHL